MATDHLPFNSCQSVDIPHDLKEGDIILCDMPTDFWDNGVVKTRKRNALVLGISVNHQTLKPEALYVARCPTSTKKFNSDTMLRLEYDDYRHQEQKWASLTVKAGRIDAIPLTYQYFKSLTVKKVGEVNDGSFGILQEKFCDCDKKGLIEDSIFPNPPKENLIVSSLRYEDYSTLGRLAPFLDWGSKEAFDNIQSERAVGYKAALSQLRN